MSRPKTHQFSAKVMIDPNMPEFVRPAAQVHDVATDVNCQMCRSEMAKAQASSVKGV